jgi:probable phosphoglycerate mutase
VGRLVVVRHGRTRDNASGRIQGQVDAPLDEVGRAQARAVAARLVEFAPDAIVSSDLSRASDTAAELVARTGLPLRLDPRLRERSFGQWQGLLNTEVAQRHPEAYARWRAGQPVDEFELEPIDEVAKRAAAGFEDAAELFPEGTVVVFGHGVAARLGMAVLLGWPLPLARTLRSLGNCRWLELTRQPEYGWQLGAYNVA